MEKAVAQVVCAAAISTLPFGFAPSRSRTNFINRGHRHPTSRLPLKFIEFLGSVRSRRDRIDAQHALQG